VPEKSGFWAHATVAIARIAAAITSTGASFIVCSVDETAFCTSIARKVIESEQRRCHEESPALRRSLR
jgi:hypothetical protein